MSVITDIFSPDSPALAPLAGVTDSRFRRICIGFGARPVTSEMVSADGLVRGPKNGKTALYLDYLPEEHPIGAQLFGSDPSIMRDAAVRVTEWNYDFIDINAGCPVKKVVNKGGGSALMKTPQLLDDIVRAMVEVATVPVTVKIRAGWDAGSVNAAEIARLCEDAGAAAVIVHPRTKAEGFGGEADWNILADVVGAVSVPVIGSGDIRTAGDAVRMRDETGVYAVMIGRRAMGYPWIFREAASALRGLPVPEEPGIDERFALAMRQMRMLADEVGERYAVLNMRKFFGWYTRGMVNGAQLRRDLFAAETIGEVTAIIADFVDTYDSILATTQPETVES